MLESISILVFVVNSRQPHDNVELEHFCARTEVQFILPKTFPIKGDSRITSVALN